jgi:hypothetical protein
MRGNKGSPYEGGHRVPFFFHWPAGGYSQGRDIGSLAGHIDVLPTLADLCGLKRPAGAPPLHGRSLRPLLEGQPSSAPLSERVLVTDSQRQEHLVRWKQTAVMSGTWRLVNPSVDGRPAALELYDLARDPAQKTNVIADHPETAARLQREYDAWWQETSRRKDEYVRIVLGSDRENPVRLTAHDWHGGGEEGRAGALLAWSQQAIRQGPAANGFWTVDVSRAGRYRIELRRWPREVDLPLNAPYRDPAPNRESTPGQAVSVVRATLSIAGLERAQPVVAEAKSAVFEVDLPAGPAELRSALIAADGAQRGAYYVYVQRI